MMTFDQQRKRIFELECALGASIKESEQYQELYEKAVLTNSKMLEINAVLLGSISDCVKSGKIDSLLKAIDEVMKIAKDPAIKTMDYEPAGICDLTEHEK